MENCLKRLAELNLKAKAKGIEFYGLIFSASGTRPDPERINNLVKVPAPRNASEVITRNISHFKKIVVSDSEDDWEPPVQSQPQELRRSVRK